MPPSQPAGEHLGCPLIRGDGCTRGIKRPREKHCLLETKAEGQGTLCRAHEAAEGTGPPDSWSLTALPYGRTSPETQRGQEQVGIPARWGQAGHSGPDPIPAPGWATSQSVQAGSLRVVPHVLTHPEKAPQASWSRT